MLAHYNLHSPLVYCMSLPGGPAACVIACQPPSICQHKSVYATDMFVQACPQRAPLTCKEWPYLAKFRSFHQTEVACCGRCVNQVKLNKQVAW